MTNPHRRDCPIDIAPPGFSTAMTRRTLLVGAGGLLASSAWSTSSFALTQLPAGASAFHAVSTAITGKADLSVMTAERIFAAMQTDDADLGGKIDRLAELAQATSSPEGLRDAADAAGLKPALIAILTAWYTGTVQTKAGPVLVAYNEALMYRPVADGLTVPTYCNKGPLWWTGLPPQITVMPTNNPKVL